MFNTIKLMKSGELVYQVEKSEVRVDDNMAPLMLNKTVEIEEGATLRSFFRMLQRYALLGQLNDWTPYVLECIKGMPEVGCSTPNLSYLEVGQRIEITTKRKTPKMRLGEKDADGFSEAIFDYIDKPYRRFQEYYSLSGRQKDDHESYSVSMTPLTEILDLNIQLGKARIFVMQDEDNLDETFDFSIDLLSLIHCILSEITFHGTEVQKKEQADHLAMLLNDTAKKIEKRKRREKLSVIDGGLKENGEEDT